MWKIQECGVGTGSSPHAKVGDIRDALVGAGGPRHQLVSSDNHHGEKWKMVESPSGKDQARRTYHLRDHPVQ